MKGADKMLKKIFEIVSNNSTQVVLKVNADDPLTVAMNPYVSGEYAYITVTKGEKHVLTITKKDGSTFSFHWGGGSSTLISENLERLKKNVVKFIEDNSILLGWNTDRLPTEVKILYNPNYKLWQFTAELERTKAFYWSNWACSWEDMTEEVYRFFPKLKSCNWTHGIAVTGIDVWKIER